MPIPNAETTYEIRCRRKESGIWTLHSTSKDLAMVNQMIANEIHSMDRYDAVAVYEVNRKCISEEYF